MKHLQLLAVLFLHTFILSAQIPAYVPQNGLQAYWPFTGNAMDQTANGYNGTLIASPQPTLDRFNSPNSAYQFNGTTQLISTPCPGVLGGNPRAVSFWSKSNVVTQMAAVSWGGNGQSNRFNCMYNYAGTGITVDCANGAITYSPNSNTDDGKWHHYIFQFSTPTLSLVEVYQDNSLITQTISVYNAGNILNTTTDFAVSIGAINYFSPLFFDGAIDDVGIWNRTLNSCERWQLYTSSVHTISATSTKTLVCKGQSAILNASGSNSYNWQILGAGATKTINPTINTTYTVSGTNSSGCTAQASVLVSVSDCQSIGEENELQLSVYPSPVKDLVNVKSETTIQKIEIYSLVGALLSENEFDSKNIALNFTDYPKGIYLVKINSGKTTYWKKILKD